MTGKKVIRSRLASFLLGLLTGVLLWVALEILPLIF